MKWRQMFSTVFVSACGLRYICFLCFDSFFMCQVGPYFVCLGRPTNADVTALLSPPPPKSLKAKTRLQSLEDT